MGNVKDQCEMDKEPLLRQIFKKITKEKLISIYDKSSVISITGTEIRFLCPKTLLLNIFFYSGTETGKRTMIHSEINDSIQVATLHLSTTQKVGRKQVIPVCPSQYQLHS